MKEVSLKELEKLAEEGWQLENDSLDAINFTKGSILLDKFIAVLIKLIQIVIKIEASLSSKSYTDMESNNRLIAALSRLVPQPRVKKWTFEVKRDERGLIKEVVARGEDNG